MNPRRRTLAVVTGASNGIGVELARLCAVRGIDLAIVADRADIQETAKRLRTAGGLVDAVQADVATREGVDALVKAIGLRPVDMLLVNAYVGLGRPVLDQWPEDIQRVIDANVTATVRVVHRLARDMRARDAGRILIIGAIGGLAPGAYQAVYNASKAFLDAFAYALRAELRGSQVTVTCFMPGTTESDFLECAQAADTRIGARDGQAPADMARIGFEAMLRGDADVVSGWQNKLRVAISGLSLKNISTDKTPAHHASGTVWKAG